MLIGMQGPGLLTDTFTYSVAISACEKGQHLERAHDLLVESQELGHELDATTFNAAVSVPEKG